MEKERKQRTADIAEQFFITKENETEIKINKFVVVTSFHIQNQIKNLWDEVAALLIFKSLDFCDASR